MKDFSVLSADCQYAEREHKDEGEHDFRDKFSRDRDRILYSKAFRRLSGKTQVFITSFDDHARTRLTHTIEVSQIAKTIAKRLGLNEVLTEAIALGHDIGHTPFGHVGERTLNNIMNGCIKIKDINSGLIDSDRGFKHNWQGVRVVRELEDKDSRWKGLNLTDYTMWGILHHSKVASGVCKQSYGEDGKYCGLEQRVEQECKQDISLGFYKGYHDTSFDQSSWSFESFIVEIADEIAQRHHDIEDGIEAKIVNRNSLVNVLSSTFGTWIENYQDSFDKLSEENRKEYYIPKFSKFIINLLVSELLSSCEEKLSALISDFNIEDKIRFHELKNENNSDFLRRVCTSIDYREDFKTAEKNFHSYLKSKVLNSYHAQSMDGRSQYIIKQLFKAYVTNPQQLPDSTIEKVCRRIIPELDKQPFSENSDFRRVVAEMHYDIKHKDYKLYRMALLRTIADYISGMTDNFAVAQYQRLYGHANGF